jgi:hypothetical protein
MEVSVQAHGTLILQGLPMRLFFHLVNGDDSLLDHQGIEASDIQDAEVQALMAIQALRQGTDSIDEDLKGWRLDVADASRVVLLSIPLDALPQ